MRSITKINRFGQVTRYTWQEFVKELQRSGHSPDMIDCLTARILIDGKSIQRGGNTYSLRK